jgi:hypothetical protein
MPEPMALSRTLWLVIAPPLASSGWMLARELAGARLRVGDGTDPWTRRVGVGSVVLASGATLGHVLRIARAPADTTALVEPLGVAAGPLQAGASLRFDFLSAAACGLACAVAIAVATFLATRPTAQRSRRLWAWLELALAGGLLSVLADGFVPVLLGWTLVSAAAAWLAGWTDPRSGAARATRGALAIVSLLFGAVSTADAGPTTTSLVAFLVAVAAMSASIPPVGAPRTLAALGCGAATGLVGPFLLLRLAHLAPPLPGAATLVTVAGIVMLAGVGLRAVSLPPGPSRWLALIGGAPAGVTCISLGADGEKGALPVLVCASLTAALLLLTSAARGISGDAKPASDPEGALLGHLPEAAGVLLLSFERWVVDAIGGAVVVLAHASAWALSKLDARRS